MSLLQEFLAENVNDLEKIASEIIALCGNQPIWVFEGTMGAGKTTLIKAIAKMWGIEDEVSSPTFSIVNHYQKENKNFYHFDFYRLNSEQEAFDIGYEEYFYEKNAYCWIEWASKIPNLLPLKYVQIEISALPNLSRSIKVSLI
ncbi:MAG: tRNA (adenosine(37)-N6)-threonylcarbamoyltransferase complex ATPase subunit type 1 TsaE [Thermonemataceae bacterium]|nr:tRNA (adenosine(37)-N6)-threonylcarbamoyltransferase complex ATPase subunit type 1 TsaE [Thermonemataceae bacterium]